MKQAMLEQIILQNEGSLTAKCAVLANASLEGAEGAFHAASAALGGAIRRARADARIALTTSLLDDLKITATQHVARHVMTTVFGQAASTNDLRKHYALPGRKADQKYVDEALIKMQDNRDFCKNTTALYADFNGLLEAKVKALKVLEMGKAKQARGILKIEAAADPHL